MSPRRLLLFSQPQLFYSYIVLSKKTSLTCSFLHRGVFYDPEATHIRWNPRRIYARPRPQLRSAGQGLPVRRAMRGGSNVMLVTDSHVGIVA